jgi:hypothetical protein
LEKERKRDGRRGIERIGRGKGMRRSWDWRGKGWREEGGSEGRKEMGKRMSGKGRKDGVVGRRLSGGGE